LSVLAARTDLPATVGAHLASGAWLNQATARYPAVVLGAMAAKRLGVPRASPRTQVWLGGHRFTVVRVLPPVPLAPALDLAPPELARPPRAGCPEATPPRGLAGSPPPGSPPPRTAAVAAVQAILAATANPEHPNEVDVSRPSDALTAKQAIDTTLTALLLGLG